MGFPHVCLLIYSNSINCFYMAKLIICLLLSTTCYNIVSFSVTYRVCTRCMRILSTEWQDNNFIVYWHYSKVYVCLYRTNTDSLMNFASMLVDKVIETPLRTFIDQTRLKTTKWLLTIIVYDVQGGDRTHDHRYQHPRVNKFYVYREQARPAAPSAWFSILMSLGNL